MNYATDRLDRASRNRQGLAGLWKDYQDALQGRTAASWRPLRRKTTVNPRASSGCDHSLLGRTTCTLGWNRHALYHYCAALVEDPRSARALGDYAQMADLAGWPELGLVALLAHELWLSMSSSTDNKVEVEDEDEQENPASDLGSCHAASTGSDAGDEVEDDVNEDFDGESSASSSSSHLELLRTEPDKDCGCGNRECGRFECAFPDFLRPHAYVVVAALDEFLSRSSLGSQRLTMTWSAHEIHRRTLLRQTLDDVHAWIRSTMPKELRIALRIDDTLGDCEPRERAARCGQTHEDDDTALHEAIRMLLVKLLYQTIPLLACAVLVADVDASVRHPHVCDAPMKEKPSLTRGANYKSHAAFATFIKALVLGDRSVKPSRRHSVPHYHVPIWDVGHGIDQRSDHYHVAAASDDDSLDSLEAESSLRRGHRVPTALSLSTQWRQLMLEATEEPRYVTGGRGDPPALYANSYYTSFRSITSPADNLPPLFIVGDSHVLSLAWQTIQLPVSAPGDSHLTSGSCRLVKFLVVPVLVTGLKAYHCRAEVRYFTQTCLRTTLRRLRANGCRTIVVSAGEIDCREGLGGSKLAGYHDACLDAVPDNVDRYLTSLQDLLVHEPSLEQILVLPVAPHVRQASSRVVGQASRRQTMREWNENLRRQLPRPGLFLVDYIGDILDPSSTSYCLRADMAADSTHMNAAFARSFERAIASSGCDMSLLL